MTFAIWTLALLALVAWTGGMALLALVAGWLADHAQQATAAAMQVTQWPVPPWIALWVDPQWVQWSQDVAAQLLLWTQAALPWMAPLLDGVAPIVWAIWGLGSAVLLLSAGAGHWLWSRRRRSRLRTA